VDWVKVDWVRVKVDRVRVKADWVRVKAEWVVKVDWAAAAALAVEL